MNELKPCPFCGGDATIAVKFVELSRDIFEGIALKATANIRCKKCRVAYLSQDIKIPIDEETLEPKSTLEKETKHLAERWNRRVDNG